MSEQDSWSWSKDSSDVVFPSMQGVAVYRNEAGSVVIRQQAGPLDDEDSFIVVPAAKVSALIVALQTEALED
ncbi:hypothetical protein [Pseudoxanthomonas winnipegensis]|uniref:hypothetical protein n=1 Tax=Pseudoxanthomonas winnipegensis TaxID=2480810 RepID=UPI00102DC2AB|nr:hypothetical protein [Pseudoxanthomonas winnipegensis]RZZ85666.1 hypothetical protein EA663_11690 [Pseudoxanthomonas winnipegensis]